MSSSGWPGTCTYLASCDRERVGIEYDTVACATGGCCGKKPDEKPGIGDTCQVTMGWYGTCKLNADCRQSDSNIEFQNNVCKEGGCCAVKPTPTPTPKITITPTLKPTVQPTPSATPTPLIPAVTPKPRVALTGPKTCGDGSYQGGEVVLGGGSIIYECDGQTGLFINRCKDGYTFADVTRRGGITESDLTAQLANLCGLQAQQPQETRMCGNEETGGLPVGTISIGPEYGESNRWKCIADGGHGYPEWEKCPGCILTRVPSYLQNDPAYQAEVQAYQDKIGAAGTVYSDRFQACMESGKTESVCKTEATNAMTTAGYTADITNTVLQNIETNTFVSTEYYPLLEQYNVCKSKYGEASCVEYAHQLIILAGKQGVSVQEKQYYDTVGYGGYIENKLINAFIEAQQTFAACEGETGCVDRTREVLSYPGISEETKQSLTALGKFQEQYFRSNTELCAGITSCNPDTIRQRLVTEAQGNLPEGYQAYITGLADNYERRISSIALQGMPGDLQALCSELVKTEADKTRCGEDLAYAQSVLLPEISATDQITAQKHFQDVALLNVVVTGDDQAVMDYIASHPTLRLTCSDPITCRSALVDKLPAAWTSVSAPPELQGLVSQLQQIENQTDSPYYQAYRQYKAEHGDISFEEFNRRNDEAFAAMAKNWDVVGMTEQYAAAYAQGTFIPITQQETYNAAKPWTRAIAAIARNILPASRQVAGTPQWVADNRALGMYQGLNEQTRLSYVASLSQTPEFKTWQIANPDSKPEDYLLSQLAKAITNENTYITLGNARVDNLDQFYAQVMRGEIKPVDDPYALLNGGEKAALGVFNFANGVTTLFGNRSGATNKFVQDKNPQIEQAQNLWAGEMAIRDVKYYTPELYTELDLSDPTVRKQTQENYAAALYIQDHVDRKDIPGSETFFEADPQWLQRAALMGTLDVSALKNQVHQLVELKNSSLTSGTGASVALVPEAQKQATRAMIEAYMSTLDAATREQMDSDALSSSAYQSWKSSHSGTLTDFRLQQLTGFTDNVGLWDYSTTIQNMGRSEDYTLEHLLAGDVDVSAGREYVRTMPAGYKLLNFFNNVSQGTTKRGNEILMSNYKNCSGALWTCEHSDTYNVWSVTRGAVMQGAAPATAAVVLAALPALPLAGAIWGATTVGVGAAAGASTFTAVAFSSGAMAATVFGTAVGVAATTLSTQQVAEYCTFDGHMTSEQKTRCGFAIGNTVFAAVSTGVGAAAGQQAVANAMLQQGGRQAERAITALAIEKAARTTLVGKIALAEGASPALQVANRAVQSAAVGLFGSQAVYECANVIRGGENASGLSCATNVALTLVSIARLATANMAQPQAQQRPAGAPGAVSPQQGIQRTIGAADIGLNTAQTIVACSSLILTPGRGDVAGCIQSAASALISAGHEIATFRTPESIQNFSDTTVSSYDAAIRGKLALYENGQLRTGVIPADLERVNVALRTAIDVQTTELARIELTRKLAGGRNPTTSQTALRQALADLDVIPKYTFGEDQALSIKRQQVIERINQVKTIVTSELALTSPPQRGIGGAIDDALARIGLGSKEARAFQQAREEYLKLARNSATTNEQLAPVAEKLYTKQQELTMRSWNEVQRGYAREAIQHQQTLKELEIEYKRLQAERVGITGDELAGVDIAIRDVETRYAVTKNTIADLQYKISLAGGMRNTIASRMGPTQQKAVQARVEQAFVADLLRASQPAVTQPRRTGLRDFVDRVFKRGAYSSAAVAETAKQMPRFESDGIPVERLNLEGVKVKSITSDDGTVTARVIDTESITDPKTRAYLEGPDGANARLIKVQEALAKLRGKPFPLYSEDPTNPSAAPQDQLGNIILGATRGDGGLFLRAPGGSGKTEVSAIMAGERFLYSGRKQVLIVESVETITKNSETYSTIFEAQGIKSFELTKPISELTPGEFQQLMDAGVVISTNKIGYEWMPGYSEGSPNAGRQIKFVEGLEGGRGFEFIVDEVKTIWDPSMRLAISGKTTVYATTSEGKADVSRLSKTLGWNVDPATGKVTFEDAASGSLVRLRDLATLAITEKGTQGLRQLFDTQLSTKGEMVLRQDIRVRAYRDILLELRTAHPEAAEQINALLGDMGTEAGLVAAKPEALTAFEQRLNGMSTEKITDVVMSGVRDEFLQQAGVMETLTGLYADVAGNKYASIRKITTLPDGTQRETMVVVPKDRNVFEGKQLSDGLQNLIYNTEGKRVISLIDPSAPRELNVNDVSISQNSQEITLLELNSRARSTVGMSLEAEEVARVWQGAVADSATVGNFGTETFLYGTMVNGRYVEPRRPIAGIFMVDGVEGIKGRFLTSAAAEAEGKRGAMIVNAANTEASDIEVRAQVMEVFGGSNKVFRNRNDLHVIETVDSVSRIPDADGNRTVSLTRQRVEFVEVNGKQQYVLVTEKVQRLVDSAGRMISVDGPDGMRQISEQVTELSRSRTPLDTSPITLSMLDEMKTQWRASGEFYVDYYEKGADIGVNPLSYADESLRVIGDRSNTSSEWYQALIRARGNEGGTADVYSAFAKDAEFVVIGDTGRQLELTGEFRTMADANATLEIQRRGTSTRLQYLNEFLRAKSQEIAALLPESCNCRTKVTSLLESGQRRMNVRIGATEVDIELEIARQAKIAQETIDQMVSIPEVQRELRGGLFGIGRNQKLASLVRELTFVGDAPISIKDRLDFSKLRTSAELAKVKPYTQGKNIAEILTSMEAYTFASATDPRANVTSTVVRGLTEPKTSLTASTNRTGPSVEPGGAVGVQALRTSETARRQAIVNAQQANVSPTILAIGALAARLEYEELQRQAIAADQALNQQVAMKNAQFTVKRADVARLSRDDEIVVYDPITGLAKLLPLKFSYRIKFIGQMTDTQIGDGGFDITTAFSNDTVEIRERGTGEAVGILKGPLLLGLSLKTYGDGMTVRESEVDQELGRLLDERDQLVDRAQKAQEVVTEQQNQHRTDIITRLSQALTDQGSTSPTVGVRANVIDIIRQYEEAVIQGDPQASTLRTAAADALQKYVSDNDKLPADKRPMEYAAWLDESVSKPIIASLTAAPANASTTSTNTTITPSSSPRTVQTVLRSIRNSFINIFRAIVEPQLFDNTVETPQRIGQGIWALFGRGLIYRLGGLVYTAPWLVHDLYQGLLAIPNETVHRIVSFAGEYILFPQPWTQNISWQQRAIRAGSLLAGRILLVATAPQIGVPVLIHDVFRLVSSLLGRVDISGPILEDGAPSLLTAKAEQINPSLSRLTDGNFQNTSTSPLTIIDAVTGKTTLLPKGQKRQIINALIQVNEKDWVWISRDGKTYGKFTIKASSKTPQEIMQKFLNPDGTPKIGVDKDVILDPAKIGEIETLEAVSDTGQIFTFHISKNRIHSSVGLSSAQQIVAQAYFVMSQVNTFYNNGLPTELLIVPPEAAPRGGYGTGRLLSDSDKIDNALLLSFDADLVSFRSIIAHEFVHEQLGSSPLAEFDEGIAVYIGSEVVPEGGVNVDVYTHGQLKPENYHGFNRPIAVTAQELGKLNSVQEKVVYEWSYATGAFLVRAIAKLYGEDGLHKFISAYLKSTELFDGVGDYSADIVDKNSREAVRKQDAIDELLKLEFEKDQVQAIYDKQIEDLFGITTQRFAFLKANLESIVHIGRSNKNSFIVRGVNTAVSREHASVARLKDGALLIVDQNSANGTLVNGQPIFGQIMSITEGDTVVLGPITTGEKFTVRKGKEGRLTLIHDIDGKDVFDNAELLNQTVEVAREQVKTVLAQTRLMFTSVPTDAEIDQVTDIALLKRLVDDITKAVKQRLVDRYTELKNQLQPLITTTLASVTTDLSYDELNLKIAAIEKSLLEAINANNKATGPVLKQKQPWQTPKSGPINEDQLPKIKAYLDSQTENPRFNLNRWYGSLPEGAIETTEDVPVDQILDAPAITSWGTIDRAGEEEGRFGKMLSKDWLTIVEQMRDGTFNFEMTPDGKPEPDPIWILDLGGGVYETIRGTHRTAAAKAAGISTIKAHVFRYPTAKLQEEPWSTNGTVLSLIDAKSALLEARQAIQQKNTGRTQKAIIQPMLPVALELPVIDEMRRVIAALMSISSSTSPSGQPVVTLLESPRAWQTALRPGMTFELLGSHEDYGKVDDPTVSPGQVIILRDPAKGIVEAVVLDVARNGRTRLPSTPVPLADGTRLTIGQSTYVAFQEDDGTLHLYLLTKEKGIHFDIELTSSSMPGITNYLEGAAFAGTYNDNYRGLIGALRGRTFDARMKVNLAGARRQIAFTNWRNAQLTKFITWSAIRFGTVDHWAKWKSNGNRFEKWFVGVMDTQPKNIIGRFFYNIANISPVPETTMRDLTPRQRVQFVSQNLSRSIGYTLSRALFPPFILYDIGRVVRLFAQQPYLALPLGALGLVTGGIFIGIGALIFPPLGLSLLAVSPWLLLAKGLATTVLGAVATSLFPNLVAALTLSLLTGFMNPLLGVKVTPSVSAPIHVAAEEPQITILDRYDQAQVDNEVLGSIFIEEPANLDMTVLPGAMTPATYEEVEAFRAKIVSENPGKNWPSAIRKNVTYFKIMHSDGTIRGIAIVEEESVTTAHLDLLLIDPKYQKEGFGSKLVQHLQNQKWNRIWLFASPLGLPTEVESGKPGFAEAEQKLLAFYSKHGFVLKKTTGDMEIDYFEWNRPTAATTAEKPVVKGPVAPQETQPTRRTFGQWFRDIFQRKNPTSSIGLPQDTIAVGEINASLIPVNIDVSAQELADTIIKTTTPRRFKLRSIFRSVFFFIKELPYARHEVADTYMHVYAVTLEDLFNGQIPKDVQITEVGRRDDKAESDEKRYEYTVTWTTQNPDGTTGINTKHVFIAVAVLGSGFESFVYRTTLEYTDINGQNKSVVKVAKMNRREHSRYFSACEAGILSCLQEYVLGFTVLQKEIAERFPRLKYAVPNSTFFHIGNLNRSLIIADFLKFTPIFEYRWTSEEERQRLLQEAKDLFDLADRVYTQYGLQFDLGGADNLVLANGADGQKHLVLLDPGLADSRKAITPRIMNWAFQRFFETSRKNVINYFESKPITSNVVAGLRDRLKIAGRDWFDFFTFNIFNRTATSAHKRIFNNVVEVHKGATRDNYIIRIYGNKIHILPKQVPAVVPVEIVPEEIIPEEIVPEEIVPEVPQIIIIPIDTPVTVILPDGTTGEGTIVSATPQGRFYVVNVTKGTLKGQIRLPRSRVEEGVALPEEEVAPLAPFKPVFALGATVVLRGVNGAEEGVVIGYTTTNRYRVFITKGVRIGQRTVITQGRLSVIPVEKMRPDRKPIIDADTFKISPLATLQIRVFTIQETRRILGIRIAQAQNIVNKQEAEVEVDQIQKELDQLQTSVTELEELISAQVSILTGQTVDLDKLQLDLGVVGNFISSYRLQAQQVITSAGEREARAYAQKVIADRKLDPAFQQLLDQGGILLRLLTRLSPQQYRRVGILVGNVQRTLGRLTIENLSEWNLTSIDESAFIQNNRDAIVKLLGLSKAAAADLVLTSSEQDSIIAEVGKLAYTAVISLRKQQLLAQILAVDNTIDPSSFVDLTIPELEEIVLQTQQSLQETKDDLAQFVNLFEYHELQSITSFSQLEALAIRIAVRIAQDKALAQAQREAITPVVQAPQVVPKEQLTLDALLSAHRELQQAKIDGIRYWGLSPKAVYDAQSIEEVYALILQNQREQKAQIVQEQAARVQRQITFAWYQSIRAMQAPVAQIREALAGALQQLSEATDQLGAIDAGLLTEQEANQLATNVVRASSMRDQLIRASQVTDVAMNALGTIEETKELTKISEDTPNIHAAINERINRIRAIEAQLMAIDRTDLPPAVLTEVTAKLDEVTKVSRQLTIFDNAISALEITPDRPIAGLSAQEASSQVGAQIEQIQQRIEEVQLASEDIGSTLIVSPRGEQLLGITEAKTHISELRRTNNALKQTVEIEAAVAKVLLTSDKSTAVEAIADITAQEERLAGLEKQLAGVPEEALPQEAKQILETARKAVIARRDHARKIKANVDAAQIAVAQLAEVVEKHLGTVGDLASLPDVIAALDRETQSVLSATDEAVDQGLLPSSVTDAFTSVRKAASTRRGKLEEARKSAITLQGRTVELEDVVRTLSQTPISSETDRVETGREIARLQEVNDKTVQVLGDYDEIKALGGVSTALESQLQRISQLLVERIGIGLAGLRPQLDKSKETEDKAKQAVENVRTASESLDTAQEIASGLLANIMSLFGARSRRIQQKLDGAVTGIGEAVTGIGEAVTEARFFSKPSDEDASAPKRSFALTSTGQPWIVRENELYEVVGEMSAIREQGKAALGERDIETLTIEEATKLRKTIGKLEVRLTKQQTVFEKTERGIRKLPKERQTEIEPKRVHTEEQLTAVQIEIDQVLAEVDKRIAILETTDPVIITARTAIQKISALPSVFMTKAEAQEAVDEIDKLRSSLRQQLFDRFMSSRVDSVQSTTPEEAEGVMEQLNSEVIRLNTLIRLMPESGVIAYWTEDTVHDQPEKAVDFGTAQVTRVTPLDDGSYEVAYTHLQIEDPAMSWSIQEDPAGTEKPAVSIDGVVTIPAGARLIVAKGIGFGQQIQTITADTHTFAVISNPKGKTAQVGLKVAKKVAHTEESATKKVDEFEAALDHKNVKQQDTYNTIDESFDVDKTKLRIVMVEGLIKRLSKNLLYLRSSLFDQISSAPFQSKRAALIKRYEKRIQELEDQQYALEEHLSYIESGTFSTIPEEQIFDSESEDDELALLGIIIPKREEGVFELTNTVDRELLVHGVKLEGVETIKKGSSLFVLVRDTKSGRMTAYLLRNTDGSLTYQPVPMPSWYRDSLGNPESLVLMNDRVRAIDAEDITGLFKTDAAQIWSGIITGKYAAMRLEGDHALYIYHTDLDYIYSYLRNSIPEKIKEMKKLLAELDPSDPEVDNKRQELEKIISKLEFAMESKTFDQTTLQRVQDAFAEIYTSKHFQQHVNRHNGIVLAQKLSGLADMVQTAVDISQAVSYVLAGTGVGIPAAIVTNVVAGVPLAVFRFGLSAYEFQQNIPQADLIIDTAKTYGVDIGKILGGPFQSRLMQQIVIIKLLRMMKPNEIRLFLQSEGFKKKDIAMQIFLVNSVFPRAAITPPKVSEPMQRNYVDGDRVGIFIGIKPRERIRHDLTKIPGMKGNFKPKLLFGKSRQYLDYVIRITTMDADSRRVISAVGDIFVRGKQLKTVRTSYREQSEVLRDMINATNDPVELNRLLDQAVTFQEEMDQYYLRLTKFRDEILAYRALKPRDAEGLKIDRLHYDIRELVYQRSVLPAAIETARIRRDMYQLQAMFPRETRKILFTGVLFSCNGHCAVQHIGQPVYPIQIEDEPLSQGSVYLLQDGAKIKIDGVIFTYRDKRLIHESAGEIDITTVPAPMTMADVGLPVMSVADQFNELVRRALARIGAPDMIEALVERIPGVDSGGCGGGSAGLIERVYAANVCVRSNVGMLQALLVRKPWKVIVPQVADFLTGQPTAFAAFQPTHIPFGIGFYRLQRATTLNVTERLAAQNLYRMMLGVLEEQAKTGIVEPFETTLQSMVDNINATTTKFGLKPISEQVVQAVLSALRSDNIESKIASATSVPFMNTQYINPFEQWIRG